MDTSHVVSGAELKRLRFRSRFWWAGWVLALLVLLGAVHFFSQARAMAGMMVEVRGLQGDAREIQRTQREVTDAFAKAWQEQQQTTQLVIDMGNSLRQRQEQIDQNRGLLLRTPR